MHDRLIGNYHAQHAFATYTLHNRAGTLASNYKIYCIVCTLSHFNEYVLSHSFEIMRSCWHFQPEDRPCFAELVKDISQQVELVKQQKPLPPLLSNPSSAYLKVH